MTQHNITWNNKTYHNIAFHLHMPTYSSTCLNSIYTGIEGSLEVKLPTYGQVQQLVGWDIKIRTQLWREAHFEVKMLKAPILGALFSSWAVKTCTRVWRKTYAQVRMAKAPGVWTVHSHLSGTTTMDFAPSQKWGKTRWFCSSFKKDGKRGASEENLKRCISRGKRNARDISTRHADMFRVRAWIAEKGCILEHEIVRFAKMILRDRCVQHFLYCLASLFRGRRKTLERWDREIANHIESARSRQLCIYFSFLKDMPQNFLVFNDVNVECLRKSRRFWSCDLPFFEEFSQKCFHLDLSTSTFEESLA